MANIFTAIGNFYFIIVAILHKNDWNLLQIGLLGPDQLGDSGTQFPFLQTRVSGPRRVLVLLQL